MRSNGTVPGAPFLQLRPLRNDLLLAAAWFAVGTACYLTGLQELIFGAEFGVPLWRRLAVLAMGCVAVFLRRRVPPRAVGLAVLAVIIDWFHGVSLPVVLVLSATLYSATLHGSQRVSRAVLAGVAVSMAAITVGSGALAGDWTVGLLVILQAGTILLVPVWWATETRQHRERIEAERRSAAQQARIVELDRRAAITAERARMVRDLHEVVAGHLSAIALQSEAVLSRADDDPTTVRTVLSAVRENSVQALAGMKMMIDLLHADEPDPPAAPVRREPARSSST
ncbi:MAG: histidine kinase [Pseudonocardiaceae bacterium]